MDETNGGDNIITPERAEALADAFLKERYYEHDKIVFQACEKVQSEEQLIYRFSGLLVEKTRGLIDRMARDKSGVTYKFVVEVSSKNGRVLNYYLT